MPSRCSLHMPSNQRIYAAVCRISYLYQELETHKAEVQRMRAQSENTDKIKLQQEVHTAITALNRSLLWHKADKKRMTELEDEVRQEHILPAAKCRDAI